MQQVEHPTAETNQQQEFYKLYGTYRDWIAAVTAEKTARDSNRRLSPKDHEKIVSVHSSFNDSLREIFNRWGTAITPADTMQLLNNFIPIANKPHYRKKMETSIKGVRTELLAELALENMGFKVVRATTEQDKRGIDYLITDSQGKQTAVDIKSSRFKANKTNDRNAKYYNDGTIAICVEASFNGLYRVEADGLFGDDSPQIEARGVTNHSDPLGSNGGNTQDLTVVIKLSGDNKISSGHFFLETAQYP